jgi:hypothetical protein
MSKTHYLGFTLHGHAVGRASQSDYGYTHCAVKLNDNGTLYDRLPSFSTSAQGALRNLGSHWINKGYPYEIVAVEKVDGARYRAAMNNKPIPLAVRRP